MSRAVEIDVGGWPTAAGTRVALYLDPGDGGIAPRVYTFGYLGALGAPERAYRGRHKQIGMVPVSASPDSLHDWLTSRAEEITALAALFRGVQWDGNNHVGVWADGADADAEHLAGCLGDAIAFGDVLTYWAAADYLAPDRAALAEAIEARGVGAVAREAIDAATEQGVPLRFGEVLDYLARLAAETN